ncbi:isochorismatase family protein [Sapientia aquatica]|uniref:Isochorismatase family protein n=1 Tax=Sapientia aquatica TaxID=1549640 RepID=A0A4R5W2Y0_9BURK|nr:isochorismatase family protein [Sapientia aquatica]TDK65559.1 isochorismatase family protein [Sapientia aquatica]
MSKLADAENSILVVIDFQEKLMPAIDQGERVAQRASILAQVAQMLEIPIVATEQQPQRLGSSLPNLAALFSTTIAKSSFNACDEADFLSTLDLLREKSWRQDLCIVGCEAHVCVLQTVLGLLERGWKVKLVADAVGSRLDSNKNLALQRAAANGAEIVSSEMMIFEWLRDADHPNFRDILKLIKPL